MVERDDYTPAALYARVSSDRQDVDLSVSAQLRALRGVHGRKTPLIGRFAQSGKYSYYVCQSNIKLGKDACKTPTLNARRFEYPNVSLGPMNGSILLRWA